MEHQFDELAKALAEGMSRREALRRVGGSLAAALLVSLGWSREAWGDTRAACKSVCGGLKKDAKQCMDVCLLCSSASCVIGDKGAKTCLECTGGKVCSSGTCECPMTQADCGDGVCVDTASNMNNCGTCGTACTGSQICSSGKCCVPSGGTVPGYPCDAGTCYTARDCCIPACVPDYSAGVCGCL